MISYPGKRGAWQTISGELVSVNGQMGKDGTELDVFTALAAYASLSHFLAEALAGFDKC